VQDKRLIIGVVGIVAIVAIALGIFLATGSDSEDSETNDPAIAQNSGSSSVMVQPNLISPEEYVSNFANSDEDYYLLDVRTAQEYNGGFIGGADNISHDLLAGRLNELPTDKPIVLYCNSGNRSAFAADLLADAGFSEVYDIDGGIVAWTQRNLPLEN